MPVYFAFPEEVIGSRGEEWLLLHGENGGAAYEHHRRKSCKSQRVNFSLESHQGGTLEGVIGERDIT